MSRSAQPLAIVSALPQELELLREATQDRRGLKLAGGFRAWRGVLDGREVVLAESGIGKVAMAMLATELILRHEPRLIVFTGVAGGLDPALHIGDAVIARRLIQHDAGLLQPDGLQVYQAGHLPFFNPTDELGFEPPEDLLGRAIESMRGVDLQPVSDRPPQVGAGLVLTGDVFVNSPAMRRQLFARFGAQAVEMEGAALAQVAHHFDVPTLVIRALSDLAGEEAPSPGVFHHFLDVASANSAHVVRHLLPVLWENAP